MRLIAIWKIRVSLLQRLDTILNSLENNSEKMAFSLFHIKKCIEAVKKLGVKNFSTFIGKDQFRSISDNMETFKKVWPDIIKLAEQLDIKISIENCPMFFHITNGQVAKTW